MDKIVDKIAAFGIPSIILIFVMSTSGFVGAAALTSGLALLGPGGMLGGIATLGVLGLISQALTKYGFDKVFTAVIKKLYDKGETKQSILTKIDKYPISKDLKRKLREELEKLD